jgi:hypothetical protein
MNFKNIISNPSIITPRKKNIDISTWAQYTLKNGKIHQLNPPELSPEEKQQEIANTLAQISFSIEKNIYKYRITYDSLHGEGAYDRLYYLEPIYKDLDLDLDLDLKLDSETDEENINYEQNSNCY